MYSSTAFAYHLQFPRTFLLELHLLNLLYLATLLTLIGTSCPKYDIDSSIDNLTVNDSLTGQLVVVKKHLLPVVVLSLVKASVCLLFLLAVQQQLFNLIRHDITLKYQEVQITGDADLTWGGTADFVMTYNLAV